MSPRLGLAARFVALGALTLGLALAPLAPAQPFDLAASVTLLAIAVILRPRRSRAAAWWLIALACAAALVGLATGAARLGHLDSRALALRGDKAVELSGTVASTRRHSRGVTRFILEADGGRVGVELDGPVEGIDTGRTLAVSGRVRDPAPWEAGSLLRDGARSVIATHEVRVAASVRGGLAGVLDGVRRRAEAALERGTPDASAALLRGFVLGQDDRIPEPVREDFRRSGLAHVLAVSGQNVMLLVLLATPILALLGVPLRARLAALLLVVAIYVPVAGAGASIQRAGVMGAAGLIAALAGRPATRWYAIMLAAAVTLTINPRASGDVGWQLSFAAVAGILVLTAPMTRLLAGTKPRPARRLLAEGASLTTAATLATAPLAAHHFEVVSLTALPANLVALPAIAPAMWLGMLAGALGQIPGAPLEPLTWLGGLCAGFIGWAAHAFGGPQAQLRIDGPSLPGAVLLAAALLVVARLACAAAARRSALRVAARPPRGRVALAAAGATFLLVTPALLGRTAGEESAPLLRLRFLDVGQGDAILLEPRGREPILIDTGPPEGEALARLRELGLDRLAALIVTHDDRDHSGALAEMVGELEVGRIIAPPGIIPADCEHTPCPAIVSLAAGQRVRHGALHLDALWPPPTRLPSPESPNSTALVLRASAKRFDALLTGDAEAEVAPFNSEAVDVLKVAHHGSADAGLPALLDRASPRLAVISVGENGYGHPAPETIATLGEASVPTARTDRDGEVVIEARKGGWGVG